MPKYNITATAEQEAGLTAARERSNKSRATDDRFVDNQAYIDFVMALAFDSYVMQATEEAGLKNRKLTNVQA